MALDVNSSLASTLFSPERGTTNRARAADSGSSQTSAGKKATSGDEASSSFGSYVAAKRDGTGGPAVPRSTASTARKLMPGQIAGHQDTKVAGSAAEQVAKEGGGSSSTSPAKPGADEATAKPEPRRRIGEGESERQASMNDASAEQARPEGAQTEDATTAQAEGSQGEGSGEQAGRDAASGEGSGEEKGEAATAETKEAGEAVVAPQPEATVVTVAKTTLSTQVAATTAGAEGAAVAGVGAAGAVTEGVLPVETAENGATAAKDAAANALKGVAGEAANGVEGASARGGAGEASASLQDLLAAKSASATAQGSASAAKDGTTSGIEAKDGKNPNGIQPSAEFSAEALKAPSHEGPTLRGAIFSQVLEGFAGTHGLMRQQDALLSVLEPTQSAAASHANRSAEAQLRPTPLQMLPVEIGMQAVRGAREFQIRLDPAELGRVDVKLHINDKGEVNATMIVERPETLQMLRRDAQTLAQAFDQAGLKQGENSLSFSLRGDGQQGQQQEQQGRAGRGPEGDDPALNAQISEIVSRRVMIPNSSLDLMV